MFAPGPVSPGSGARAGAGTGTIQAFKAQSAGKLKSSGLPLNGLNFALACAQLAINAVDAGELKRAVMGGELVMA